ncbi:MAG TPA: glycosyltransferase family 39 protein [Blastocatellia bacterium]|nr:glycosyltransferase family 39 protein [Blastocatellia bacterium]
MRARTKLLLALAIFLVSFVVKSLHAVDFAPLMYTSEQPMGGLTELYDLRAVSMVEGHGILIPDDQKPSNTGLLSFAPGYSIFLGAIYASLGRNFFTAQAIQNAVNSLTPVALFLLAGMLIGWRVGAVAGLLAAVSHHLSYYSNFILPDPLCALPIVAAIFFLAKVREGHGRTVGPGRWRPYWFYALAGVMLGLSAWLRPNGMLLAPFLAAILVVIAARRWRELKRGAVLVIACALTIAPITLRNYLIYGEFVPISINLGIVLWEGIGEASGDRFGAVATDEAVGQQEVILYNNPRYKWWASPDGIQRDRDRVRKSLAIIIKHPVWYAGVMLGRMREMVKYSAYAPLVFRPTDRKLLDAVNAEPPPGVEAEREAIDRSALKIGESLSWLRPAARLMQRITKEAMLPFILMGTALVFALSWRRALLILIVPLYYLLFQSAMHTEFRYALAMHYFLFICAAIVWVLLGAGIAAVIKVVMKSRKQAS